MTANYLNLAIGAPRRLAILRAFVETHNAKHGGNKPGQKVDWRTARFGNFKSNDSGLWQGFNGTNERNRVAVWYTQDGAQFRREKFADECEGVRIDHTGWYCDEYCDEKSRGIVAFLPHGRFIAGYLLTCNDERVYFSELYDNERDAARAADGHAETIADSEREHQEKYREASKLDEATDTALGRLRECLALRNNPCFVALRDEARELIETIKDNRVTLSTTFKGVL